MSSLVIISIIAVFVVILIGIVLGVWSKQKQAESWREFATQIGAEFVSGGLFRRDMVQAQVGGRTVTLDTYSVPSGDSNTTYTCMKTAFIKPAGFQFMIFRTGLISKIDKALGSQDIEIGDAEFDRQFTIQSNNEARLRALLASLRLRQLIQGQKAGRLGISKNNELRFEVQGVIKDVERMKSIFELFKETLQQLDGGPFA
jgi:hypothetical protein